METSGPYAFSVGVHRRGALLRAAPASAVACLEDALWQAVLTGEVRNGDAPDMAIEPLWAGGGPPGVVGVRVALPGATSREYGLQVFKDRANGIIRELVKAQEVRADDVVEWAVEATAEPATPAPRFRARTTRAPFPLRPGRLPEVRPGTFAVAIEREALAAIRDRVLGRAPVECAGVLAGHLVHDLERRAVRLEITGQVAVEAGERGASMTHFAFGTNSFVAARRMIADMGEGTVAAGWWHSHPPCADCPRNPSCRAETIFFSSDDAEVHAAAFPAAYAVAIVAGKLGNRPATDPGIALYAWSHGAVEEVPLRRLRDGGDRAVAGDVRRKTPVRRARGGAATNAGHGVVRTAVRVVRGEGQAYDTHEDTAKSEPTTREDGTV
jgi:hypothetical protein